MALAPFFMKAAKRVFRPRTSTNLEEIRARCGKYSVAVQDTKENGSNKPGTIFGPVVARDRITQNFDCTLSREDLFS